MTYLIGVLDKTRCLKMSRYMGQILGQPADLWADITYGPTACCCPLDENHFPSAVLVQEKKLEL